MIRTEVIEPANKCVVDWPSYVANAPGAALYHQLEWQEILVRSFAHRCYCVIARDDGAVRGVLPLIEMKSAMFGHFLVSLPFVNYGGILADGPQYEQALADAAIDLAIELDVEHIELRQSTPTAALAENCWAPQTHKSALVVSLGKGPEKSWASLSSRLRGKIRKAEKSGAAFSMHGPEALEDFYRVYSLNMRNLGTPVYTSSFFRNIVELQPDSRLLIVRRQGAPVAAALALFHGDRVELPWICSDYAQSQWHVNELLYWKAIEWASMLGARELDLGRSTNNSGPYRFKMQWNPEIRPLYWYVWLAPGSSLPALNPNNPKFALAVRCWKLLPISVANRIGPWVVRNIP